jgi:small-conductance mechanosensitive channel
MDDRTLRALVTALAWAAVVLAIRFVLGWLYGRWECRRSDSDPADVARRRTTFSFLQRILVAIVAAIGVWSVLSIFPQTSEVARAVLASSAVLAVFAGLALNTPLGNLGSGVLVAFTQPLRIGDRVTVGEQTGFVEQINLIYTELVTDDDRRIFVPNTQLTTTAIVNRTIKDPRRSVTATFPIRLDVNVSAARQALLDAAAKTETVTEARITVGEITDRLVWLTVTGFAPLTADVVSLSSDLREQGLVALGDRGLLPS